MENNRNLSKPNILFIVMDSLRYDHVGKGSRSISLTPSIDSLTERGIVFTQAIAQGPSTRVSMNATMSSTYASMHGGPQKLSASRPVIQQMLKETGYSTAGVTANLYLSRYFGWQRGFDYYDDCRPESIYQRKFWWRAVNQVGKRVGRPLVWPKSLPAKYVFENADRFLKKATVPFFLWVHLMDTHWPYSIQKFSWDTDWKYRRLAEEKIRPRLISDPPTLTHDEAGKLHEEYEESVVYTDHQLGSFIRRVETMGLMKNSWLVLTADHGEEFLDHGKFFHHPTPYEELAHVPLIIVPPDNFSHLRGKTITCQVRLIDLVPTFLELAQASTTTMQLFGDSLLPLFGSNSYGADRPAITESPHNQALSLRQDGWKYIWEVKQNKRMLFNLQEDPHEQQNLVSHKQDYADHFHNGLETHLATVGANSNNSQQEEAEINQEMIERLRGLGYVE